MKAAELPASQSPDVLSDILHGLSQPLTALECGLELSLHRDKTVAQYRSRAKSLLVTAHLLHQRLLEIRALHDAGEAGDTPEPVLVENLLQQLAEDFAPLADHSNVRITIRGRPVMVAGNAARLRNGFFRLLEFLVDHCPRGGMVRVVFERADCSRLQIRFRICGPSGTGFISPPRPFNGPDFGLRIAERAFQAAGGGMTLEMGPSKPPSATVTLQLAKSPGQAGAVSPATTFHTVTSLS